MTYTNLIAIVLHPHTEFWEEVRTPPDKSEGQCAVAVDYTGGQYWGVMECIVHNGYVYVMPLHRDYAATCAVAARWLRQKCDLVGPLYSIGLPE